MQCVQPNWKGIRVVGLMVLSSLALLPGLGSASRLTFHEAFVAQGAREILASGQWAYPTIGGLPWLEKPPLPWWIVAVLGHCAGGVTETVARLPSAVAAVGLVLAVAVVGKRYHGPVIGTLAAAIQATTVWTVVRGRLAECDIMLACVLTWGMVVFDRLRSSGVRDRGVDPTVPSTDWRLARWGFFVLLGVCLLIKGIGFGSVLIMTAIVILLLWERDWVALRRLWFPKGWALVALIGLTWPLAMVVRHGSGVLDLWALHLAHRVGGQPGPFAGELWWEYVSGICGQALPWTPLAVMGAWSSLACAVRGGRGTFASGRGRVCALNVGSSPGDRLLWAWAVGPLALLSLAAVRNAHYVVFAQVPWSVWAAIALARWGTRLYWKGWTLPVLRQATQTGFVGLALTYGLGLCFVAPWFDCRGQEWAFYGTVKQSLSSGTPLLLLYDDWDREPYPSPFGSIPHDLAVRLFYLDRPACWHDCTATLVWHEHTAAEASRCVQPAENPGRCDVLGWAHRKCPGGSDAGSSGVFGVIGRARDLPALSDIGSVEILARGPELRRDRTYYLFRVTPQQKTDDGLLPMAGAGIQNSWRGS
jgi:4-amino-4-deoxy-L-arabinose transferase-like glycosyltransferase